jgi:hypothetical protein
MEVRIPFHTTSSTNCLAEENDQEETEDINMDTQEIEQDDTSNDMNPPHKILFIQNIPRDVNEEMLRHLFMQYVQRHNFASMHIKFKYRYLLLIFIIDICIVILNFSVSLEKIHKFQMKKCHFN